MEETGAMQIFANQYSSFHIFNKYYLCVIIEWPIHYILCIAKYCNVFAYFRSDCILSLELTSIDQENSVLDLKSSKKLMHE